MSRVVECSCRECGEEHPVEHGTTHKGQRSETAFYKCGDHTFLAGIGGKQI